MDYLWWIVILIIIIVIVLWFSGSYENFYVAETPRRNMSYDLRGDPFRIPKQQFAWNNSEIPEYNIEPAFYGYGMTQ
jgi:hypothetical protein